MTDTETTTLHPFEGHEVVGTTIMVSKAGDGLSAAVEVEPVELRLGQKVYVVLECDVADVRFADAPKMDDGSLVRKHKLATVMATVVEGSLVEEVLDRQRLVIEEHRLAVQRAKEEADGVARLPGTEPWPMPDDDVDEQGEPE